MGKTRRFQAAEGRDIRRGPSRQEEKGRLILEHTDQNTLCQTVCGMVNTADSSHSLSSLCSCAVMGCQAGLELPIPALQAHLEHHWSDWVLGGVPLAQIYVL